MKPDPFLIPADDLPPPDAASPAEAPPPPEDDVPTGVAMQQMARLASRRRTRGGRWFWAALGSLVSLIVSVAAYDYVTGLIARSPTLGALALGLIAILALMVLAQLVRELWAFRRLARIDRFRADAAAALAAGDRAAALDLSSRLERFYAGRPELSWGRDTLADQRDGVLDADAIVALTERTLFTPLDAAVRSEIEASSRTVAAATALIPLALVDVLAALSTNIRMIRHIADIYGAHSGFFGSWRLLGAVATHLLATGALAAGDDLVHSVIGGHALAKLSRRFGEGVVNGALTARVGLAAMDVCRPLPFAALTRPRVSNLTGRALTGLFPKS